MDRATLSDWIAAYERLWRTPGTDQLGRLFSDHRCIAFEEWPFWPPGTPGRPATGAG